MKHRVEIFDSTLRDGAQGEGISFSVNDKLNIVKSLDAFGVDYIEAGNPGSNPKDMDFFKQVSNIELKNAKLCAFGSTCRNGVKPEDDANIKSLLASNTKVVVIFGKAWDLHVTEILKISLEENLNIVKNTIEYLKSNDKYVIFDAEHFFDGFKANEDYAMKVLETAAESGADTLTLCDTNGGTLPSEIYKITSLIKGKFSSIKISIHCHNDSGCAVANSMLAIEAGADQVQGTFIGIGERCGNADLSVIIPNLKLKAGCECNGELESLFSVTRRIAEIANTQIENNRPYTGQSAFAHKGGMHIDGVLKITSSFEHVSPEAVGNKRKFLMSEVSGRSTLLAKAAVIAPELKKDSPEAAQILEKLKEMEHYGYHFEAADASFELLVKRTLGMYKPHFKLVLYKTMGDFPIPEGGMSASATIKVEVDGQTEMAAAMGNGPVNALDLAMRKALSVFFPSIGDIQLTDYKVRVLEENSTTAAKVRVLIETADDEHSWTTIGVSNDIIEASITALVDSIEYKLAMSEKE
ncbi:MAG: citramalate synthase [Clostridiales bacterium GWF2_36_10]|nr:MAG: citramalate synthase [Clostridiales bacterium GWF2_36_10]HAN20631.1 citramalate synthase [Clostridiales bacterium]